MRTRRILSDCQFRRGSRVAMFPRTCCSHGLKRMGISARVTSIAEVKTTLGILFFLIAIAAVMTWRTLSPKAPPHVHTQIAPGHHLTFVLLAPTTDSDREYQRLVDGARNAMSQHARESGFFYSTIGVSDDWSVERGLRILGAFGMFDELIVGRNWFNTGVERYITTPGALAAFPQVLVLLQERWLEEGRWVSGDIVELIRLVGSTELGGWSNRQFTLPVTTLPQLALRADSAANRALVVSDSTYNRHADVY